MKTHTIRVLLPLLALAVFASAGAPAGATAPKEDVFAPGARPYDRSYSEWAAAWWTWAVSQPVATNPVLDTTGASCSVAQKGKVWFLAGTFSGSVERTCTVPKGKALLVPVLNFAYFAFATDPPEQRTERYVRDQVRGFRHSVTSLTASIDGRPVPGVAGYFEESALFRVVLPDDNIFGLDAGFVLDPCVDAGYYLVVKPLAPGRHTIRFGGSSGFGGSIQATYHLTVARSGGDDD
jgi:hypothetical protein